VRRREFIVLLGGAAVLRPLAVRAQQKAMPVIGFIGGFAPSMSALIELEQAAFRQGLSETGFVEGQNVTIEYRWGEGHLDRLPALVADLVARRLPRNVTSLTSAACSAMARAIPAPIT
jgi:putative ABC transport system substrate-binding protein